MRAASIIKAIIIALMKQAARNSETSVYIQLITRKYIPEDMSFILAAVRTCNLTCTHVDQIFITNTQEV
jgi:hypothetical protein